MERRTRKWTQRERTAHHEAGHAAVAFHCGFPIKTVSIRRSFVRRGNIKHGDMSPWVAQLLSANGKAAAADRFVLCCLAGFYAECRLTGGGHLSGASDDINKALEVTRFVYPSKPEAMKFFDRQRAKLKRLFANDGFWAAVCELAERLLEDTDVSGATARQILKQMQK
jgi:hypothetical protein